jgi:hypothetical protein
MFPSIFDERGRYDIMHNAALRGVLDDIPFWSGDLKCEYPVYRAETFRELKAAGLTGLQEARDYDPETNVTHHRRGGFIGVIP